MPAVVEGERLISWCLASPGADGGHQAVIITEPKSTMHFPHANAVKHRLPEFYDAEAKALAAAVAYRKYLVMQ